MTTNPIAEAVYNGEFVLSEGPRSRSRDTVTVEENLTLAPGTVLGYSSVGTLALAVAALGTNTGNATFGTLSVAAGTPPGEYDIVMESATQFVVLQNGEGDAAGVEIGHGVLGTAFSQGGLTLTGTAGGTACVAGDSFKATVSQSGALDQWAPVNASATDGTQNAAAILFDAVTTPSSATGQSVAITRQAEVKSGMLTWPSGATGPQIAAWTAQLAALGIIIR